MSSLHINVINAVLPIFAIRCFRPTHNRINIPALSYEWHLLTGKILQDEALNLLIFMKYITNRLRIASCNSGICLTNWRRNLTKHPLDTRVKSIDYRSWCFSWHYHDVIISGMASLITSLTIVYSTVYSGADQRKHQSSASLAFVRGIHRGPVKSPHKWPVTRKIFPFDDVIMETH